MVCSLSCVVLLSLVQEVWKDGWGGGSTGSEKLVTLMFPKHLRGICSILIIQTAHNYDGRISVRDGEGDDFVLISIDQTTTNQSACLSTNHQTVLENPYLPATIPVYLPILLFACLLTYLPPYLPTCLSHYELPEYQPACLPTSLPAHTCVNRAAGAWHY